MRPIALMIIIVIPSTSALVDCWSACRTCREKAEGPSVLEVYCAMCEECKLRRREKLRLSTADGKQNQNHETTKHSTQHKEKRLAKTYVRNVASMHKDRYDPLQEPEYQHNSHETASSISYTNKLVPQPSYRENPPPYLQDPAVIGAYESQLMQMYEPVSYPDDCPTPASCTDSEEEYSSLALSTQTEKITIPTTSTTTTEATTTTMTTTTTTPQPCPRITHCKRKRPKPRVHSPPPPVQYFPQPNPCMNPCLPPMIGSVCPCPQYQPPTPIHIPLYQPFPSPIYLPHNHPRTEQPKSTTKNFFYIYVGVPKNVLNS